MSIYNVISMIGGLALFLYGMNMMGAALTKMSGSRLERILERLTDNPLKAVALGAAVTALIQSSSATTVMVVGFVNSGIMRLAQAIGVIMGANIGTTVTAWVLSLVGIESDNFFISMLKPANFSPILAMIGVIMLLAGKRDRVKNIGAILTGFAILMYGMDAMSTAVKPLANVPEFTNLMVMFSNPVLGVIVGALLTAVIQSSSASVGILQAMSATKAVTYATAVPIIMGQNIGTCVTAMLSSIGTSKNARRAACVHLSFNLIGTFVFMLIFYLVNAFVHFDFLSYAVSETGIAVIHSVFNILVTVLLLPFIRQLERLACILVRDKEMGTEKNTNTAAAALRKLDPRFLDMPAFGIEQSHIVTLEMAEYAKEAVLTAISIIGNYDKAAAERISGLEELADHYEDEIGNYLVQLSAKNLSEQNSRLLNMLLHTIGDFERISDHAMNLMESARELAEKKQRFSSEAKAEIDTMLRAVTDVVELTFAAFSKDDLEAAAAVEPVEAAVDALNDEIKRRHVRRLRQGKCTIEMGFILSDITTDLERVSDHCSNIAICLLEVSENSFEMHEYLENRKQNDEEYRRQTEKMLQKYVLP